MDNSSRRTFFNNKVSNTFSAFSALSWIGQILIDFMSSLHTAKALFPPLAYTFDCLKELTADDQDTLAKRLYLSLGPLVVGAFVVGLFINILNPIAWTAATVLSGIGWIKDCFTPLQDARTELKKCEQALAEFETNRKLDPMNRINYPDEALEKLIRQRDIAKQAYLAKRSDAAWGMLTVVGMALFTCGTFALLATGFTAAALAAVALVGSALFAICATRGLTNTVVAAWNSRKKPAEQTVSELKIEPELTVKQEVEHDLAAENTATSVHTAKILQSLPPSSPAEKAEPIAPSLWQRLFPPTPQTAKQAPSTNSSSSSVTIFKTFRQSNVQPKPLPSDNSPNPSVGNH